MTRSIFRQLIFSSSFSGNDTTKDFEFRLEKLFVDILTYVSAFRVLWKNVRKVLIFNKLDSEGKILYISTMGCLPEIVRGNFADIKIYNNKEQFSKDKYIKDNFIIDCIEVADIFDFGLKDLLSSDFHEMKGLRFPYINFDELVNALEHNHVIYCSNYYTDKYLNSVSMYTNTVFSEIACHKTSIEFLVQMKKLGSMTDTLFKR